MDDFISSSVSSFIQFLSEKTTTQKKTNENILASFAMLLPNDAPIPVFNSLSEKSFYFEKPDENFLIFGDGSALFISEKGEKRFASLEALTEEWKAKFISNWENFTYKKFPLFLGAMKFMVEHSDEDWKDFEDSNWFVPELLFLKKDEEKYLIFNSIVSGDSSKKKASQKFEEILKRFLKNDKAFSAGERIRIIKEAEIPKEKKKWKQLVNQALELIEDKEIDKIVLSRKVEFLLDKKFEVSDKLETLKEHYPSCFTFSFVNGRSTFFGATPERLARFSRGTVEIDALAGSMPRGGNDQEDMELEKALLSDEKNLAEHQFVVQHISEILNAYILKLEISESPKIKKLENIQHLWTSIKAELNESSSIFSVVKILYPTPAVCGTPKQEALNYIKKLEPHKRGLYSGIIGWFNLNDEGEFAVAIRSALTYGKRLVAFAGSGIVAESDPDLEFQETELKLKPIVSLLRNEK